MSKQCLDVQQMQHLQKLGLDTSNASMCWIKDTEGNRHLSVHDEYCYEGSFMNPVPAYTLQDVLDALPDFIDDYNLIIGISFGVIRYDSLKWEDSPILKETYFNDEDKYLIDAAYELLVWCVENKFIETNKNENNQE